MKATDTRPEDIPTVADLLSRLENHGTLYVKRSGTRTYRGVEYPRFSLVLEQLPPKAHQENLPT